MNHKPGRLIYRIALLLALAFSLILLWKVNQDILSNPGYIPVDDFGHYWAAGALIARGDNPYDPVLVQQLRDSATGQATSYDTIPIMWTPPWSLILVLPFGLIPYALSRVLWLMVNIAVVLVSADLCWQTYGGSRRWVAWVWIASFSFGATISVLQKGQITPWVFAGIVGFLYSIGNRSQEWRAGIFAALITLKPQLFYLFWPAWLLWSIQNRRWTSLAAGVGVTLAITLPALALNPAVVGQYLQAVLYNTPSDWATPTLGGYLRLVFGIEKFWLQFVPPVFGLIWFSIYWLRHRRTWNWLKQTPLLLLVSILTAPYAWSYDQVILLPAVLLICLRLANAWSGALPGGWRAWQALLLSGSFFAINLLNLFLHRSLDEFWFGWLAPVLLLWYWLGLRLLPPLSPYPKKI